MSYLLPKPDIPDMRDELMDSQGDESAGAGGQIDDNELFGADLSEKDPRLPFYLGETHPSLPRPDQSDEALPCRILSDFSILDEQTKAPISLFELDTSDSSVRPIAVGLVRPLPDDSASDEETELEEDDSLEPADGDSITVCTTSIYVYWTGKTSTVWLRTFYAWYLLDTPSRSYRELYGKFWVPHAIANLAVDILSQDAVPELRVIDTVEDLTKLLTIEHAVTNHPFECERILDCPLAGTFTEHVCTRSLSDKAASNV